jgi:hypothetical protein
MYLSPFGFESSQNCCYRLPEIKDSLPLEHVYRGAENGCLRGGEEGKPAIYCLHLEIKYKLEKKELLQILVQTFNIININSSVLNTLKAVLRELITGCSSAPNSKTEGPLLSDEVLPAPRDHIT